MTARASAGGLQRRGGVMFVTDRRLAGERPILEVAAAALAGGASFIQVRERDLGGAALLELTAALVAAAKAHPRARIVVNDRLDVAIAAHAAGVHLPAAGLPIAAVRAKSPARFLVGRSVHSVAEAREAAKAGADYLVCGPVFATPSKAAFGDPIGPEVLRKAAEAVRVPVWAIGGITVENAPGLRALPIAGVAVIGAIMTAADPAAAVTRLRAALGAESDARANR
jgi:thiamine-phosphate pyrophosphorylase